MTNALYEPKHHAILTIDIEGFGSPTRTDPIRAGLRRDLDALLRSALKGMPQRDVVSAEGDTGDGKWLLFRPDLPKTSILHHLVPGIEMGIRHHNRSASTAAVLRLRVGVHHGEVTVDERGGYSGEQLNHAFRIIDNDVIRDALRTMSGDVILAISHDFFQKIVQPGYGALDPDDYAPVIIKVKETNTVVWVKPAIEVPATAPIGASGSRSSAVQNAHQQVLTLRDLPPSTLYVAITDVHNTALYRRRFPEAPVQQHLEAALLLADKVVIHCADPYRSSQVAATLEQLLPCVSSGDMLFLLGENTQNPRTHFRGYIDQKIQQYGKSELGQRDVASLENVENDAVERAEALLGTSPFGLIRGFSGADGFNRAVRRDLQPTEPVTICEHFAASIVSRLSLTLRQLLDLTHQSSDGAFSRVVADSATVGRVQADINRLANHNSFSRQILMAAIRRSTGIEDDAVCEAFEERVSLLHLAGTTGGLPHMEVTNRRDRLSVYYFEHLLNHLSAISEVPHPGYFGTELVMELRSLPIWRFFAAHHVRLVSHLIHQARDEPPAGGASDAYTWSRRIPEFEGVRTVVRRYWEEAS
ncbi:hypothetical protein [Micromonospora sp. LH3U1]|uniref:hypothetical protein n=1 Tax=Micromonospora sp. LH3U1 TaxID=3018339 RepID=UPI00234B7609|nr:hypothetical protein [Micromonospora sp. LH3U1]WCN81965.1 hypothetical protein PCA76_02390 [Micromonospora sp. LH3U1]